MRWDLVARINGTRWVRALSIWFLVLPIAAKVLEAEFMAPWLEGVGLPFTWGILYAAALLFFASSALYAARCPEIIRNYASWSDFVSREGSYERLVPLLIEVAIALPATHRGAFAVRMKKLNHVSFRDESGGELLEQRLISALSTQQSIEATFRRSTAHPGALADVYAAGRETAQRLHSLSRYTVFFVQLLGGALLLWVAIESSWSVAEYYLPDK